jgi:hypothetical protein
MKKGVPWAFSSFDTCTSWIFLGVTWASPSLSFCSSFISSHHSPFPTLENFIHTKLHTILISNISLCKIVDPLFWFNFNSSTTLKHFRSKELKKKEIKRQMQIVAEISQNRTAGKDRFFRKSSVAQIEKCKSNKSYILTYDMCTQNCRSIRRLGFFMNFYIEAQKSVSGQQFPQILPSSY